MELDEAVVLRTYAGEAPAIIAASRLGSEGIETLIQKDDCGGAYPSLQMAGGVRLLVRPEDRDNAERILNQTETEDSVEVEPKEDPGASKSSPFLLVGLFLLGLGAGYVLSPSLRDPSTYTGVEQDDRNREGKTGSFGHFVDGRLTRVEQDRNYDGKIDARHKYAGGKHLATEYDNNFDGTPDGWVTYKDRFNYVEKVDTDFDGKPDATVVCTHGVIQRRDWHPKDAAIIHRRELYEHGVMKEALVDTDLDGYFDLRITYDRYERPIEETRCRIPN